MSFSYPWMIGVAVVVVAVLVVAYRALDRRRSAALASFGAPTDAGRRRAWRRHIPPLVFLAGLAVLLVGVGRPQATVQLPRVAGTVILAFDVSNSMMATDVVPSRLAAAQEAAISFVRSQPSTVDIGVVSFERAAMTARAPTNDHEQVVTTIERLRPAGGTSLGQAILASLTAITDKPISLPADPEAPPPTDLGYWGSATIVVLSDGEDTGGPDAVAAAELAATAGVRIQTVGIGTVEGTIIEVEGYQVATALNEVLLTEVAEATAGTYHQAADVDAIGQIYKELELRITSRPELLELTGAAALLGLALLTVGGLLMTAWYGRIV